MLGRITGEQCGWWHGDALCGAIGLLAVQLRVLRYLQNEVQREKRFELKVCRVSSGLPDVSSQAVSCWGSIARARGCWGVSESACRWGSQQGGQKCERVPDLGRVE